MDSNATEKPSGISASGAYDRPVRMLFFRYPGGAQEHPENGSYLAKCAIWASKESRIESFYEDWIADTPITMVRNRSVEIAKKLKADYLVMLDSDMHPDLYVGKDPTAVPFLSSAFEFAYNHPGPCIVAAPYCGPPVHELPYIFKWANHESDSQNPDGVLEMYSREEAAVRTGFEKVAALPTGLILIDMRVFDLIGNPAFYYEWTDDTCSEKASTEDVTFTRDVSFAGVPLYCQWSSWAGHYKQKRVGKPQVLAVDDIPQKYREANMRKYKADKKLMFINEGKNYKGPVKPESMKQEQEVEELKQATKRALAAIDSLKSRVSTVVTTDGTFKGILNPQPTDFFNEQAPV